MNEHADSAKDPEDREREARHHDLSRERSDDERASRSDEVEERRVERAQRLAVKDALRNQMVDSRLDEIDRWRREMNGSLARTAQSLERIETKMNTRDAVNVALIEAAAGQGAKKLTRFQSTGIIVMALLTFGMLITAVLQAVH